MAKTIFELLWDLKVDRNGIAQQLNQVRDDINGFNQRIKDQTAIQLSLNVGKLKAQLDEVKAQLKLARDQGNRDSVIQLTADASRLQQSLTQAGRELRNYTRTGSADISVLGKNFQGINSEVLKQGSIIQSTVEKMKVSFVGLKEILITAFSVTALTQFIRGVFDLTSQVQQAKISFTTLFKSEEIAVKLLKDIQTFAKQTPFEQFGLVDGAKRLAAYGFKAQQILPIMKSLGDAVAGVGGSQETLNGVIVALGQMQTKGKLVQQEVNQIAERGIPIFEILREKLGLTQEQLADIGNQNISSAQAIPLILEGINEKFGGLMEQQAQTLQGRLSNIIDSFKINMSRLGEVLEPIFSGILSSLSAIVTPAFNILILGVKGFMFVFKAVFEGANLIYTIFANNFVIITKTVLASFLTALVIMKQQTIISFVQGVVNQFIRGMTLMGSSVLSFSRASLNFIVNIRQITADVIQATIALGRKAIAWTVTTARTYAQIIANNIASFSFRALGVSILSVIKNLIFLGARFFLIASIVTAIVVAIFTNWNTLKEKLKPVFDFMAKIGQAVPQAIAKAWNFAVDVIFGAIKGILSSGKAVADFLKNTFNVDIGTANIEKYIASIDQARNNLQTNADEVKSIFEGIADETGNAFTFIKDQVLGTGASTDQLGDDVLGLAGKFDDMGSSSEDAHKKGAKAGSEAQEQLKELEGTTKDLEKANDKLEKTIQNVSEAQQEYKDAVVDSTNTIKNNLRETQREYDKTIKKIQETREEEIKNIELQKSQDKNQNVQQFAQSQAEDLAKSQQDQTKLETKLSGESDSDKRVELQQQINQEIEKQVQLQKNLDDLKKQAQKDGVVNIDQLIQEQQLRAKMTDEQRAFYDFKKQQEGVDIKAQQDIVKANQKAVDDQKQAETELAQTQQSLETQKKIISALDNVKSVTKAQVESFLSSASFSKFDEDSQKLLEKLLDLKLKISDATREKQSAQADVTKIGGKLQEESANSQLANIGKTKKEYQELLTQINDALAKSETLKAQSKELGGVSISKPSEQGTAPVQEQPSGENTANDQAVLETKKANIQQLADFKLEKSVEDAENQLTSSEQEIALHLATIQQIQDAQTQSLVQLQQIRRTYFANLVSTTRSTVTTLMGEYSRLITQLLYIISLQQRAGGGGRGFAVGGFTGGTDRNKIAGVVHQGEYVVPKWMVDKYTPLVTNLENIRMRGFATGGYTSTTNRSVNINGNIHVGSGHDLNQQLDYWKWKI